MSKLKIKNGSTWEEIPAGGVGVPSGGNAGDVLVKSSSTDYATQWSSPSNAGCIQMELLWTNPNPSSAFAAQTIALDMSYDAFIISFTSSPGSSSVLVTSVLVGQSCVAQYLAGTNGEASGNLVAFKRTAIKGSTGIEFTRVVFASGSWADYSAQTVLVPFQIYGIKGAQ